MHGFTGTFSSQHSCISNSETKAQGSLNWNRTFKFEMLTLHTLSGSSVYRSGLGERCFNYISPNVEPIASSEGVISPSHKGARNQYDV